MNETQLEIKNQLEKFRLKKISPIMAEDDKEGIFRMELFQEIGALGYCGMIIPEKYNGAGLTLQDLCVALDEIAKSSVPLAVTISVSCMVQTLINEFGTEEQKTRYIPDLSQGKEIGSFALSESHSGSDSAALKLSAKKVDGGYVLNGSKMWITSGGIAKTYIVMARTGKEGAKGISAFLLQKGAEGFSFGKNESKMGCKTSPTRELIFENCFVADKEMLGQEGQGFKVAMSGLDKGRICIAAIAVGLAQAALDEAVRYALQRRQFEDFIFNFQGLQFLLADMATEIETSRALVEKSAYLYDCGRADQKLACMAKLKSTDMAMFVTTNAVQVLGGVGYTTEYPVEGFMRDAKVLQIVEGTNQIQKIVIARKLKKEYEG